MCTNTSGASAVISATKCGITKIMQKLREVFLYEWAPGQVGKLLIYLNRKPCKEDPGVVYSYEVLKTLYERGKLTGVALQMAGAMYSD